MIKNNKNITFSGHYKPIPCPRCNGSGIAYCCDGEDYNLVLCKQSLEKANTL